LTSVWPNSAFQLGHNDNNRSRGGPAAFRAGVVHRPLGVEEQSQPGFKLTTMNNYWEKSLSHHYSNKRSGY